MRRAYIAFACTLQVLIVGAGPCGLRMAIECALLGARTVVIEARDYISRNNVLHLWPFVIQDIKRLGGKVLFRQFCTGGIDHISKSDLCKMTRNLRQQPYTDVHVYLQRISPAVIPYECIREWLVFQ